MNGVHASASPLEAFHERLLWLTDTARGASQGKEGKAGEGKGGEAAAGAAGEGGGEEDTFVAEAVRCGAAAEAAAYWRGNPTVTTVGEGGSEGRVPLFDVVELMDTEECIRRCIELTADRTA